MKLESHLDHLDNSDAHTSRCLALRRCGGLHIYYKEQTLALSLFCESLQTSGKYTHGVLILARPCLENSKMLRCTWGGGSSATAHSCS